jgi:hypothetical protein
VLVRAAGSGLQSFFHAGMALGVCQGWVASSWLPRLGGWRGPVQQSNIVPRLSFLSVPTALCLTLLRRPCQAPNLIVGIGPPGVRFGSDSFTLGAEEEV